MRLALNRLKALAERLKRTRVGRALTRYSTANGALLAGGIAYTGLYSAFAALVIGVSVLMALVDDHGPLRDAVLEVINETLPGVVDDGSGDGLVSVNQLTARSVLNTGSVLASLVLAYTAVSLMGALKSALRAMFGIVRLPQNPLLAQVANVAGFVVVVVGVLATAVASLVTSAVANRTTEAADWIPGWLSSTGTRLLTLTGSAVVDAFVLAALIAVSGIRPPWRDLVLGCALGAVALGAMRELGARVVGSVADNPLLASAAALVALVLWLHLGSRILLLVAAWMANPPRPQAIRDPAEVHARERPNYVTVSVPETLEWPRQSLTGDIEVDRGAVVDVPISGEGRSSRAHGDSAAAHHLA